jgi:hypothetical protein
VQGAAPVPDADLGRQREVVDAFFAAARDGDFDKLAAVLDPDIVLRSDGGSLRPGASVVVHGAHAVAERALSFARLASFVRPALINGAAGVVVAPAGRPFSIMGFTVTHGRSSPSMRSPTPSAYANSTSPPQRLTRPTRATARVALPAFVPNRFCPAGPAWRPAMPRAAISHVRLFRKPSDRRVPCVSWLDPTSGPSGCPVGAPDAIHGLDRLLPISPTRERAAG